MFLKAYYHIKKKCISETFQRHHSTIVRKKVHTVKETIHPGKRETPRPAQGNTHTDQHMYTQNKDRNAHMNGG